MKRLNFALIILSCCIVTMTVLAQSKSEKPAAAKQAATDSRFQVLRKLVGEWQGKASHGDMGNEVKVNYTLTAAGSVLMETLFPGTDHEMVTMYHMDGEDLVLTHYCSMGNQPRMKAELTRDLGTITFTCAGGTNIKSENDAHMHGVVFTIVDDDHIKTDWTMRKDGKDAEHAMFELTRKSK